MFRFRGGWNASFNGVAELLHVRPASVQRPVRSSGPSRLQPYVPPDDQVTGLLDASFTRDDADVPAVQRDGDGRAERGGDLRRGVDGARAAGDGGRLTMRPTKSVRSEASVMLSQIDRDVRRVGVCADGDSAAQGGVSADAGVVLPGGEPVSGAADERAPDADGGPDLSVRAGRRC